MSSDLYSILGVAKNADSGEIRKAFTKLAKTHHPDKGGDAEEFKKIHKAFETLSDEEKRRVYDLTGQIPGEGDAQGGNPFHGNPFAFDISSLFGMFGPHMNMGGGGPGPNRRRGVKPPPKVERVRLTLTQFYNGSNFEIRLDRSKFCTTCTGDGAKKKEICPVCHGSGTHTQVVNMNNIRMHTQGPCGVCAGKGSRILETCDVCTGTGKISEKKVLDVHIAPGTQVGEVIVFQEVCSETQEFEKSGDLHIVIDQSEDTHGWKRFGPKGQHFEISTTLTLAESLTGCIIRLDGHPSYDDGLFLQIPPGSFEGDIYCVNGLGMPILGQTGMYGDIYVHIHVSVKLTERRMLSSDVGQTALKELFKGMCRIPEGYEDGKTDIQKDLYLSKP